jgi:hypothetical protein
MKDDGPKPRKKRRWKGELARPIRPEVARPRGLALTEAEIVAKANEEMEDLYRQAIQEKRVEKLSLLMDHYGVVDKTDFRSLALALAIDCVPGFRIDPTPLRLRQISDGIALVVQDNRTGRHLEWSPERLDELLGAVEDAKRKHGLSTDREAIAVVARKGKWRQPTNHKRGHEQWLETLESRLQDAKRSKREIEDLLAHWLEILDWGRLGHNSEK